MKIQTARFPLQRFVRTLPKRLQRIKLAQFIASLTGSPYHHIAFQQGQLIGNVNDCDVANYLVKAAFADFGYFEIARRLLIPGDVHVDVGANYGFHTFGLLQLPNNSEVKHVLVDANPDCIACLFESAKLHPGAQLKIFHRAAAAEAGHLNLSFAPSSTGGGYIAPTGGASVSEVTVPASPLDDLLEENGIHHVGLMKMDIEGSEPLALRGLSRTLSSHRVNFVYFEVNPSCLERQQTDPATLFGELTRHGYRLFWPHDGVDWILKTYGQGNATAADLRRFTISGSESYTVIEFDQSRYRAGQFGQCDLLAVSPKCRVDPHVSEATGVER